MGRILAIDYGKKRTGIAVTDITRIIANGLCTVPTHTLLSYLADYFAKETVDLVVIGLPRQNDGSLSDNANGVKVFAQKFLQTFPDKTITFYDERFTSVLAHKAMIEGGVKKKQRQDKALVDEISATIILQSYLESIR